MSAKLSKQTLKTLQKNKKIRNKLAGENAHIQQCNNIPDIFIVDLVYHRECYQNLLTQKPYSRENVKTFLQFLDG